jgi:hypothetical protein
VGNYGVKQIHGEVEYQFSGMSNPATDFATPDLLTVSTLNITTQPASHTLVPGNSALLTVVAEGFAPLNYQWIKNGTNYLSDGGNVSGAATATLTVTNVQTTDAGNYQVAVSNAVGWVVSEAAVLNVVPLRFVECFVNGSGLFQTRLIAPANTNVVLETRTASTPWTPRATNSAPDGIIEFMDMLDFPDPQDPSSSTNRFYRARLAP